MIRAMLETDVLIYISLNLHSVYFAHLFAYTWK
jgi:hypothetical protein